MKRFWMVVGILSLGILLFVMWWMWDSYCYDKDDPNEEGSALLNSI